MTGNRNNSELQKLRDRLRAFVQAQMATDTAHDVAHLDRVWANIQQIVTGEGAGDLRILLAAVYLHDMINLPKDSPERTIASTLAAKAAGPVLAGLGFSQTDVQAVQHVIAAHSYSAGIKPVTLEAEILRDADRLDAIGAIGVARTFAVAGSMELNLYDPDDPFAVRRNLDDRRFALDHWRVKLLGLGDGLITGTARAMVQTRLEFMRRYLEQLAIEIGETVPDHWQ